jgi:hypothetical protein
VAPFVTSNELVEGLLDGALNTGPQDSFREVFLRTSHTGMFPRPRVSCVEREPLTVPSEGSCTHG